MCVCVYIYIHIYIYIYMLECKMLWFRLALIKLRMLSSKKIQMNIVPMNTVFSKS